MTAAAQTVSRADVWEALSELYLDNQIDCEWVANRLATTELAIEELEAILFSEVHPVLCWNLRLPAGEWARFNKDWLAERITEQMNRPAPGNWIGRLAEKRRRKDMEAIRKDIQPDWERVAILIEERREQNVMPNK
jgi:hypothetical protein